MIYRIILSRIRKDLTTGKLKTFRGGLFSSDALTDDDSVFFNFLLNDLGVKPPKRMNNPRARFYFTEAGWNHVGKVVMEEINKKNYTAKIIKLKNPRPSNIYYSDAYQVAILYGEK